MEWANEVIGPMTAQELRAEVIQMGRVGWELVNAYAAGNLHYAAMRKPVKVAVREPIVESRTDAELRALRFSFEE